MKKPSKRRAPTRASSKPVRRSTSTALARRTPTRALVAAALDTATLSAISLASEPMMSTQFVGTLTLKDPQIAALRRPVGRDEIEWKPAVKDGPPVIPYLSHNGYRDRLDAAFGLGGWGMAPVGAPKNVDGVVYVPYALCIGGVPRIYTWGEQALHKMTYGDALEGAKSNAILRCGKELGIARELWNRKYIASLRPPGRRQRDADPLGDSPYPDPAEMGAREERPRYSHTHKNAGEPITQKQRQRLYIIATNAGRDDVEVKRWLKQAYGYDSSKQIRRDEYDAICTALEARADLPEGKA